MSKHHNKSYRRTQSDLFNESELPNERYLGSVDSNGNWVDQPTQSDKPVYFRKKIGDFREINIDTQFSKAKRLGWRGNGNLKKFLKQHEDCVEDISPDLFPDFTDCVYNEYENIKTN